MIVLRKPYVPSPAGTLKQGVVVADTLDGLLNGTNQIFQTTYNYKRDHITVHYNGQALHAPEDFTQSGNNQITFKYIAPLPGENLRATYELDGSDLGSYLSGTELISVGSTSHTVSMGTTLSGIDYQVDVELVSSDTSPCVYGYVIGNKTNSGFTVYFSGEIDTSNYSLDWIVRA